MKKELFVPLFRMLARRYSACLAEAYRIGLDNFRNIGIEVREEIAAIHKQLMEVRLDDVDMDEIFAAIDEEEPEKVKFYGQWNRVSRFIILYEEMFGEDKEVLKEAAKWGARQRDGDGEGEGHVERGLH